MLRFELKRGRTKIALSIYDEIIVLANCLICYKEWAVDEAKNLTSTNLITTKFTLLGFCKENLFEINVLTILKSTNE